MQISATYRSREPIVFPHASSHLKPRNDKTLNLSVWIDLPDEMCFVRSILTNRREMSRDGACRLLKVEAARNTPLKDSKRSVENRRAGPNRLMYDGRCTKKWNLGFTMRMLGLQRAVLIRKSSINVPSSSYNCVSERQHSNRQKYLPCMNWYHQFLCTTITTLIDPIATTHWRRRMGVGRKTQKTLSEQAPWSAFRWERRGIDRCTQRIVSEGLVQTDLLTPIETQAEGLALLCG